MKTVLKTTGVNKYFYEPQKFQVLEDIKPGCAARRIFIVGSKSGCGKSTLLYVISTMDTDYEGTLEINGMHLTGKSQNELARFRNENIGFVFSFIFCYQNFQYCKTL